MRPARLLVFVGALFCLNAPASAAIITVDYSTISPDGLQGLVIHLASSPELFTYGGQGTTSGAGAIPTFTDATSSNLFARNDGTGEQGLGVCSDDPELNGPECQGNGHSGGGEVNELSNQSDQELIALALLPGSQWLSLTLQSLDDNSGTAIERGVLMTSSTCTAKNLTFVTNLTGGANPIQSVDLHGLGLTNECLFVIPWDYTGGGATNNGFLLGGVVYTN